MSMSTWRGSISIEIPEEGASGAERAVRWARIELDDFFWIGRCSICNLRIQGDTQVSRLQATIHRDADGYLLSDMQSRNGTSVNGRSIQAIRLVPGDRVKVGQTLFEFEPDRKQDTVFHQGTSRVVGAADVELKSFPCSIRLDEVPEGFVMHEVAPESVDERPPAAPHVPRVTPHASSLEEFVTIVVDRLVSEVQATLGILHVPPVGGRDPLTVARGMVDGKLQVLAVPGDTVRRVAMQLQPIPAGDAVPEDGERLIWRDGELERRLGPAEKPPRRLGEGAAATVALPRVGRMGTYEALAEPTRGMAWIHVEGAQVSRNLMRLVEEVAAAANVSVIRFLERGSA